MTLAMLQAAHEMNGSDVLSLSMFWTGALMAFAPLIFIGAVLAVWWRGRKRAALDRERPAQGVQDVQGVPGGSLMR